MAHMVDINCDPGDGSGASAIGEDDGMMSVIASAHVACGVRGADPLVMERTAGLAPEHGVQVVPMGRWV
jgi:UPF0271 protein